MAAAFPVLAGLGLLLSPLGRGLSLLSFDSLFLFRPTVDRAALSNVVILNMDEDSRKALRQNPNGPWDRSVHARLVRELKARGARAIVFDVLFDEESSVEADTQLGQAIREHGRVVLAASRVQSRDAAGPSSIRLLRPINALSTNALWGVVEWPRDEGAAPLVRRQFTDLDHTNLAWQAAVAFDRAPAERLRPRWLNFYGPGGGLATVSYFRALEPALLPADFFAGKAVFVGPAGIITSQGQTSDTHPTPFSHWRPDQAAGVELHATAFLNLVRGDWLEELPPLQEVLLIVSVGLLGGLGLTRAKPWTAIGLALGGVLAVAVGAIVMAWGLHRWFPWLIVCAAQVPCALAVSLILHTRRLSKENETLEKRAAFADSIARFPALLDSAEPTTVVATSSALSTSAAILPTPAPPAAEALPPPIPNHRMIRCIGRGAYGEVWLARDEIGTHHAVKVIYRRSFSSPAPYEREFRGIQKFTPISRSHPGFVHILHVGRNDAEGYFFYIMELGDDEKGGQKVDPATYAPSTLARRLETCRRLELPECVQLGLDLTAALECLHRQQLIHRDIKPSNIIFVNAAPKFADVGLVTTMTPAGDQATIVGTLGYMAPEGPGTATADLFSLGKVLYEACTGRDRRQFPSLSGTLLAAGSADLTALNEIILKACQPQPANRYQTATDMRADLAVLLPRAPV